MNYSEFHTHASYCTRSFNNIINQLSSGCLVATDHGDEGDHVTPFLPNVPF